MTTPDTRVSGFLAKHLVLLLQSGQKAVSDNDPEGAVKVITDNADEWPLLSGALRHHLKAAGVTVDDAGVAHYTTDAPQPPQREQPSNVHDVTDASGGPLKRNTTLNIQGTPGQWYAIRCADGMPVSLEVGGSPPVIFGVVKDVKSPIYDSRRAEGAGTAAPIRADAGEYLVWKFDAQNTESRNMRPQGLG